MKIEQMILISSKYDSVTTKLNNLMHSYLIPYLVSKGKWDMTIIEGEDDRAENIYPTMEANEFKGVYITGHGGYFSISGHPDEPTEEFPNGRNHYIFYSNNPQSGMEYLEDKIVYALSCYTGVLLGPSAVNVYGCKSYAGYDDKCYAGESQKYIDTIMEYWYSLADGLTTGEAYQRTIDNYNYWIDYYISTGEASKYLVLIHNRDCFVLLGDTDVRLIDDKKITDMENFNIGVI